MKKFIILALGVIMFQSVEAKDQVIEFSGLPAKSQQIVTSHFDKSKIALIKKDAGFFNSSYDVVFNDGNEIEFNDNGEWKEIDCKYSALPQSVVPQAIQTYVSKNYPNIAILKIEKDRGELEVKLANKTELTFNSNYQLIDIDHD